MKERLMEQIETEDRSSRNRFRLLVGAAAAAIAVVAVATAVIAAGDHTDGSRTDVTSANQPDETTTTTGSPATTVSPTTTPSTTATTAVPPDSTESGSGGSAPPASQGNGPSVRDVDFANRSYPEPFPSLNAGHDVTLHDGGASLSDERPIVAGLEPVVYDDFDGDGDEDALVVLFAHHQMAELAAAWAAVYRIGANGQPEIVGTPLRITDNIMELQPPSGRRITAIVYLDPVNLGAKHQRTWEFDGNAFHLIADNPYPG
jgi:hypothetical protein